LLLRQLEEKVGRNSCLPIAFPRPVSRSVQNLWNEVCPGVPMLERHKKFPTTKREEYTYIQRKYTLTFFLIHTSVAFSPGWGSRSPYNRQRHVFEDGRRSRSYLERTLPKLWPCAFTLRAHMRVNGRQHGACTYMDWQRPIDLRTVAARAKLAGSPGQRRPVARGSRSFLQDTC
jgi:hypothetical protein